MDPAFKSDQLDELERVIAEWREILEAGSEDDRAAMADLDDLLKRLGRGAPHARAGV
jgi:hypothetical protein